MNTSRILTSVLTSVLTALTAVLTSNEAMAIATRPAPVSEALPNHALWRQLQSTGLVRIQGDVCELTLQVVKLETQNIVATIHSATATGSATQTSREVMSRVQQNPSLFVVEQEANLESSAKIEIETDGSGITVRVNAAFFELLTGKAQRGACVLR
jgi:hypothetical protein